MEDVTVEVMNAVDYSLALKSAASFKIEKAADNLLNYLTYLSKKTPKSGLWHSQYWESYSQPY